MPSKSRKDISYGIIPLKQKNGKWQVLLIHHVKGHWAFPKGHQDLPETPLQAAIRELKEETGLDIVSFLHLDPFQEHYFFYWEGERIEKTVIYFSAIVEGDLQLEWKEVDDAMWLSLEESEKKATFQETKKICKKLKKLKF